jgi:hypothetical protein
MKKKNGAICKDVKDLAKIQQIIMCVGTIERLPLYPFWQALACDHLFSLLSVLEALVRNKKYATIPNHQIYYPEKPHGAV